MHRLLSLDPKVRAPMLWELVNPVPSVQGSAPESDFTACRKQRASHIRKLVNMRAIIGDSSLDHIHEVNPDLPEECLFALTDELPLHMQHIYADYMNTEVYMALDATKAYLWYRKVLQLLTYQVKSQRENPMRWALKCPIHLFYIQSIQNAFPDAKVILILSTK
jgi:hypothetical protein